MSRTSYHCARMKTTVCCAIVSMLAACLVAGTGAESNQLVLHPVTEGMPLNKEFTVRVRIPGKEWREVPAYLVKVDQVKDNQHTRMDSSMALFDSSGTVELSIHYNPGSVQSVRVRPLSFGIKPETRDGSITFSLSKPSNLSVEVNGDIFHNLQILPNPLETDRPDAKDTNVIYYGPGLHRAGTVRIASGKTVYLAGGALVQGEF